MQTHSAGVPYTAHNFEALGKSGFGRMAGKASEAVIEVIDCRVTAAGPGPARGVQPRIDAIFLSAHNVDLHSIKLNLSEVRDAKSRFLASSEKQATTPRRAQNRRAAEVTGSGQSTKGRI